MAKLIWILFFITGCSYMGSGCAFEAEEIRVSQDSSFFILELIKEKKTYKLNKDCFCQKESKILNTTVAGLGLVADILTIK